MERIKILLDSGCDIAKEEAEQYGFGVVPLIITDGEQQWTDYDGIDILAYQEHLRSCSSIPTTAQPSPQTFLERYESLVDQADHILVITMSVGGSGTFYSAVMAKEMFEDKHPDHRCRIWVHDSWSCSMVEVMQAKAAHRMALDGKTMGDILVALEEMKRRSSSYYLVNNIDFLIKGGRVGNLKGAMVSALNIKPIISIVNGYGSNHAIAMGYSKGLSKLAHYFVSEADETTALYLTHCGAENEAKELAERIRKTFPNLSVQINRMWGTMSTQAGPGTIGMFYEKKH